MIRGVTNGRVTHTHLTAGVSLGNLNTPGTRAIPAIQDVLWVRDGREDESVVEQELEYSVLFIQPVAFVLRRRGRKRVSNPILERKKKEEKKRKKKREKMGELLHRKA